MRTLAEGRGAAGGDVVPDELAPEEHDDALVTRWRVQRGAAPRPAPRRDRAAATDLNRSHADRSRRSGERAARSSRAEPTAPRLGRFVPLVLGKKGSWPRRRRRPPRRSPPEKAAKKTTKGRSLSAAQRNRLADEDFAFPKERKEPLVDARARSQRDLAVRSGRGRDERRARPGLEAHRGGGEEVRGGSVRTRLARAVPREGTGQEGDEEEGHEEEGGHQEEDGDQEDGRQEAATKKTTQALRRREGSWPDRSGRAR